MILSVWSLLLACEGPVQPRAPTPPAPAPAAAAPAPAPAPAPAELPAGTTRTAKVVEVLTSGQYSILRMDACGSEAWVAGPKSGDPKVGAFLEMPLGTQMTNFEARELGRTFDAILFVDWWKPAEKEPVCPKPHSAQNADPRAPSDVVGTILETMESGGYRYARLDVCGTETWVAGPKVPIKVGEVLLGAVSTEMQDFTSPSLGKHFDRILFLKQIAIGPTAPDCKGKAKAKN